MKNVENNAKMQIEVWSDFLCPYCYVGNVSLKEALTRFEHSDEVQVIHRAFELHPEAPRTGGVNQVDDAMTTYGMAREKSIKHWQKIKAYAATVGLYYNAEHITIDNTFDAHRLMKLAERHGKDDEMYEKLFDAHFVKAMNVADHKVLTDIAVSVGLDSNEVKQVLNSTELSNEVKQDEQDAEALNFEYIPAYYINRTYGINGVKSTENILELLNSAWNNEALDDSGQSDGPACGIHGCK